MQTNSLDPMLKSFLDQLPPTIKSPADNTQYQRLIDNWGTSYVTWSNFGGGLNLDIFTNGSFDRSQSQEWKSDQHSLAFHFHLYDIDPSASIAGFTNKSQIHVNQSFVNESRVRGFWEHTGLPLSITTTQAPRTEWFFTPLLVAMPLLSGGIVLRRWRPHADGRRLLGPVEAIDSQSSALAQRHVCIFRIMHHAQVRCFATGRSMRMSLSLLIVRYQKLSKLPYLADSHPQTAATLDTFIMEYLKNAMRNSSAH